MTEFEIERDKQLIKDMLEYIKLNKMQERLKANINKNITIKMYNTDNYWPDGEAVKDVVVVDKKVMFGEGQNDYFYCHEAHHQMRLFEDIVREYKKCLK